MKNGLSFSARDLITQMVREGGWIRGNRSRPLEPMCLHRTGCPDKSIQVSDVQELRLKDLIEFWKAGDADGDELYRPSAAGKTIAGAKAAADAERTARKY
jgi:hypothetical protein